ncbi:MAG: DMT family transporter [Candidatus Obscuribacterales bacterium]
MPSSSSNTSSSSSSSVRSQSTGWVLLALTAASIEPILIKLGFQAQATPVQLLVLKNLVAAAVMLLLVRGWKRPAAVSFASLLTVSLLLFATNAFCIFALTKLTAVELITIITSTPVVVALVNCFRRHDSRGKLFWFGLAAALVGVLLSLQTAAGAVLSTASSLNVLGVICALAAVLSSTTYRIKIESILRQADPRLVSLNIFVINALVSLCLVPWLGPIDQINQGILPFAVWMGVAAALANLAFIAAIKDLGATRMSVINLIQRPMIIIIAAFVLRESLGWPQVLGFVLVMLGVQMAQVKPKVEVSNVSAAELELALTAGK